MSDKAMGSCEDPNLVDEPLGGLPPDLRCLLSVRKERGDRDNYGGFDSLGLVDESGGLKECANSGIERISCLEVDSQVLNCDGDTTNQTDNRLPVCSEVASDSSNNNVDAKNSLVFNCDGDMTNQADNHLPLCSEVASDLSNYNVDAKNSLDGFCSSSQDFGLSNCSVDRKNTPDRILSSNQACDLSNFNRDSENPLNGFVDLSQNQGNGLVNSYVGVVSSSVDSEGSGNYCADPVLWLTNQKSQNSCGVGKVYFKESKTGNQLCFLGCEGLLLETEGYQGQDGSGSLALDGEAHLGSSPIVASFSNCIEQSEHKDSENVDSPSEDNSTDIPEGVDEKCEDLAVISNNLNCQPSQKEKVACNLMEGPPNLQSGCAVKESFSFQPSQSLCLVDSGFPKSSIVVGNEKQDIEGNDVGFDHVSITECDNVRQSYLRRSSRVSKSSQMIETKSATRQPKKAASRRSVPCRVLEISFKTARGRRSCSHKVARASIWGTFANVLQLFKQNREIQMHDSRLVHVQNVELHEARSGHGRARRKKTLACESSRGSKEKLPDSSRRIRLKVKMGKEEPNTMLSEVIETLALEQSICHECLPELDCGVVLEVPKLANDAKHEICEDVLHDKFDAYVGEKELESVVTEDTSVENAAVDCHWVSSQIGTDALGETVDNKYSELGTSPDSEVINLIHDAPISAGVQDDLQDAVLTSSQVISPSHVTASNMECMTTKREKKKDKFKGRSHSKTRHCNAKETSDTDKLNKAGKSKKHKSRGKLGNIFVSATTRKASNNSSGRGHFLKESELLLGNIGHGVCHETSKLENGTATSTYSKLHAGITSLESWTSEGTMPSTRTKGEKLSRSSKSDGGRSQCRLTIHDSARRHRGNGHGQKKEKAKKSVSKGEVRERDALDQDGKIGENNPETDGSTNLPAPTGKDSAFTQPFELSKTHEIGLLENLGITSGNEIMSENICNLAVVANGFWENLPPRKAWVRCDDCHKWRSISAALADSIEETNRNWFCNENLDKSFADCSIPQEKSNAEINAELNISDASCEEDACDLRSNSKWIERRPVTVPKQASWTLIKSNVFLHRSRKNQTIDEIMVCHCKATVDGSLGCRDECLNRMLNIECVKGTCPCGNLCSNQQFQKRKYAKLKWFRCGKKGYGLQLLEDVSQGEFLIEYVGEVLDFHAYEVRQQEYASRAQKHFYFMTLNGSEVIDACAKGNLGRFINHSCDPNCRTEKWMVHGEVCIGLFAIRDIKKGEEVTFDYNYVRVFGAAAKKCVCGSSQCRGYIGGDPLTSDAIVQGDSDEEYPEPVMVFEDGESCSNKDDMLPTTGCFDDKQEKVADISLQTEHSKNTSLPAIGQVDISVENEDNVGISSSSVPLSEVKSAEVSLKIEDTMMQKSAVSPEQLEKEDNVGKSASSVSSLEASLKTGNKVRTSPSAVEQMEDSREAERIFSKAPVKLLETSHTGNAMDKLFFDSVGTNRRHKSDMVELKPKMSKARHLMKSSRSSSSLKGRSSVQSKVSEVTPESTNKPRKQLEGAAIGRLEGVEDKLNELLDDDGGISKRKDATKGYLKLLLVTAASRDSCNHKAIQSTRRDLSMILDAILKTKSRGVLVDIISKNGLQMLHNIMKQSRRDHHQIPILRKLLKVLEFLALKDVLTSDHINGGPPCLGMESFRESIFTLTEHDDRQVHQIARKFRDRWIPRKFRRVNFSYRDDAKLELLSGSNCNHFSSSYKHWHDNGVRPTEGTNSVSRGMAASTPVDASTHEASCSLSVGSCPTIGIRTRKRKSRWDQPAETNPDQKPEQLSKQKIDSSLKQELEDTHHQPVICKVVPDQVMDVDKEEANCGGCISNCRLNEAATVDDVRKQSQEDAPPGFSSSVKCSPVPINASAITTTPCILQNASHSGCTCDAVTGHPQGRYLSYLPVSYGIPLSVVQQFGTPKVESTNYWTIAPGVPFHPFPPLPPFPREDRNPPPHADKPMMVREPEEIQQACRSSASYHTDPSTMSKSGVRPSDVEIKGDNNQHLFERARCSSHGLGRKFRHQKWHYNRDRRPPGVRRRSLGFKGIEYSV